MPRMADPNAREELLRAARTEFAKHGLERARIEDIAKAAGLSKGAFYLHFASKEAVFQELLQRLMGALEEMTARRLVREKEWTEERGPMPRTAARARAWLDALTEFESGLDVELLEMLWRQREVLAAVDSAGGAEFRPMVNEFRRRLRTQLSGEFVTQQRHGKLRRELDPDALADLLTGAYEAFILRMCEMRSPPDFVRWSRTLSTVLFHGIMPPANAADADLRVRNSSAPPRRANRSSHARRS